MAFSARPLLPVLSLLLGSACGPPKDAERFEVEPSADHLDYFLESYESSRAHFRDLGGDLAEIRPELAGGTIAVPSAKDEDLSIDWLYLPSEGEDDGLLILICGTHGSEAYATCAVLRHFLVEVAPEVDGERVGLLLIHGLNPWGFKHFRRVTEQNVDLNRNFALDESLYDRENEGYRALDPFLNPREPVGVKSLGNRLFTVRAMAKIVRHGMAILRQAIGQGQYDFSGGIFFGGEAREPQAELIAPLFIQKGEGYETVVLIDLHTGYGERGTLHLFPNPPKDEGVRAATEAFFNGYDIDWGDEEDFYQSTGNLTPWVGSLLPSETVLVPLVFEYGTLDSQTTGGAIESLHRIILENQGLHHGYRSPQDEQVVKARYREMFCPSSPWWREKVMRDSEAMWDEILRRLGEAGAEEEVDSPADG